MATFRPIEARVLIQVGDSDPVEVGTLTIPLVTATPTDEDPDDG